MNIAKQNETFILEDTTEVYETRGSINHNASGSLNIHFNVKKLDSEIVGDCHYDKYAETNAVNFSVNCPEEFREELATYADTVIDSVLAYFN